MLKGKTVLLGVTGSIAAYKIAILARLCKKAGADVLVMGTGFFRTEEPEKLMELIDRLEEQGCGL